MKRPFYIYFLEQTETLCLGMIYIINFRSKYYAQHFPYSGVISIASKYGWIKKF